MAQQEDAGKMFIGGVSADTTQASLKDYFEQFGEVVSAVLMVDNETKRSRGFGFVTFRDPNCVRAVEECPKKHILNGKQIDPKRAVPKGPGQSAILKQMNETSWSHGGVGGGGNLGSRSKNPNKIFVGGVGQNTTEDHLKEYFSTFGEVVDVRMPEDRKTGNHRGFAFVGFQSSEPVTKTRGIHYHMINGKTVEVKSLDQAQNGSGRPPMGGGGMGGYGEGYGHPDGMNGQPHYMYGGQGYSQLMGRGYGSGYGAYGVGQQSGYGQAPGAAAAPSNPYGAAYGGAAGYGDHHALSYGHTTPASVSAYGSSGSYGSLTGASGSALAGYGSGPAGSAASQQAAAHHQQQQATDAASAEYRYNPLYGLGSYAQDASKYGPSRTSYAGAGASELSSYGHASASAAGSSSSLASSVGYGASLPASVIGAGGYGAGASAGGSAAAVLAAARHAAYVSPAAAAVAAVYGRGGSGGIPSAGQRGYHPYGR